MLRELLARCRFPDPGTPVVCAVSGGADSLALLVLAVEAGCEVTAIHVDHGLRPGSDAEAEVVAAAARRFGAAFEARRAEVADGPNLEARARAARYAVLPEGALLGHTADDHAETILLNLLRGAGLDGLAAFRPDDPRRPLLALRRHETAALCAHLGLEPVADPSNADPRFRRNRVRAELVSLMSDIAGRDVVPVLTRQAAHLREVADLLAWEAESCDPTDARALAAAEPAIARVALRAWLRAADGERHPPDAATVERVLEVARGERRATEVGAGRRVTRSQGRLRLEPPAPAR